MKVLDRVKDKRPSIEVKDAIVARSGIYIYSRSEVEARGFKPKVVKDCYREFRPAAVIAQAASLFDMVPVPNAEHIDEEITPDNFHQHASAMIGGPITVVPMPDGINIGLQGRIAFFTKDAYEYYVAGNRETSADYISEAELVDNPDEVGYDLIMTKIKSVNNVAITAAGRGGKDVRIQDSALPINERWIDEKIGGKNMGFLSNLLKLPAAGEDKKFSAVVKDSLAAMKDATAEQKDSLMGTVMSKVNSFTECDARSALVSAVRDSFLHPEEVLAKWPQAEKMLDGIHARCQDAEAEFARQLDAVPPKKDDDEDDDDKKKKKEEDDKRSKDSVEAMIDGKITALKSEIGGIVAKSIKEAMGLGAEAEGADSKRVLDAMPDLDMSQDADFAITGAFGK